jgi:hypothetical protein
LLGQRLGRRALSEENKVVIAVDILPPPVLSAVKADNFAELVLRVTFVLRVT